MTAAAKKSILVLVCLSLLGLLACPGWGTAIALDYLEVTLDADGTVHLLTAEKKSGEGGPISSDPIYANLAGGELISRAPGPQTGEESLVLVDGQGQVLAQPDSNDMENNLVWLDGQTWRSVEIPTDLGLSEDERGAVQRMIDNGLGWIGDDGVARFVDFPDPYPTDHDEWYAEVAAGLVVATKPVTPSSGPPMRFVDPQAPGGPHGLFGDGPDNDELVPAELSCGPDACTWETDLDTRMPVPSASIDSSSLLLHTAHGVPILLLSDQDEDGEWVKTLFSPTDQVQLGGVTTLFEAHSRPSGGIAVASYLGHEEKKIGLWLVDEDFEVSYHEIDMGMYTQHIGMTVFQPPGGTERIQVIWIRRMRVHGVDVDAASGEQTEWVVKL